MDNYEQERVEQEARHVWTETFFSMLTRGVWVDQALEDANKAYHAFRKIVLSSTTNLQ